MMSLKMPSAYPMITDPDRLNFSTADSASKKKESQNQPRTIKQWSNQNNQEVIKKVRNKNQKESRKPTDQLSETRRKRKEGLGMLGYFLVRP